MLPELVWKTVGEPRLGGAATPLDKRRVGRLCGEGGNGKLLWKTLLASRRAEAWRAVLQVLKIGECPRRCFRNRLKIRNFAAVNLTRGVLPPPFIGHNSLPLGMLLTRKTQHRRQPFRCHVGCPFSHHRPNIYYYCIGQQTQRQRRCLVENF